MRFGKEVLASAGRRSGLVLLAASTALWPAYAVVDALWPPFEWPSRWWHLGIIYVQWGLALLSVAWLLGWDAARVAQVPLRRALFAPFAGLAILAGGWGVPDLLRPVLGVPAYDLLVPEDNAGAPSFPAGKHAVVLRDWWREHPIGRGDPVWLMAEDLPPEHAALGGPARVVAMGGDRFNLVFAAPIVNDVIATRSGMGLLLRPLGVFVLDVYVPHPDIPGEAGEMQVFDEQVGAAQPSYRTLQFRYPVGENRSSMPSDRVRPCTVPRGHAVVMRDNRAESRPEQDSRSGYLTEARCPVSVPLAALRHRPTILAYDYKNAQYTPREVRLRVAP